MYLGKRRIGVVGPLLAQGVTAGQQQQTRPVLLLNTPPAGQIGCADVLPNLLLTTLATVAANPIPLPLSAGRVDVIARAQLYEVLSDVYPDLVLRGTNQPPPGQRLDASAPSLYAQYVPQVDVYPNLVIRGQNQPPPGKRLDDSAPTVRDRYTPQVDVYPNLVLRGQNQPPVGARVDASAPSVLSQYVPQVDFYPNLILRGTNQPPVGARLDASAPAGPYVPQVDVYPNLAELAVAVPPIPLPLSAGRVDVIGLALKYEVVAEQYRGLVLYGQNQPPVGARADASAPAGPYVPQVDSYPNLAELAVVIPPIPLPLSASRVDVVTYQGKYEVSAEQYQNFLVIGIPPPPVLQSQYRRRMHRRS